MGTRTACSAWPSSGCSGTAVCADQPETAGRPSPRSKPDRGGERAALAGSPTTAHPRTSRPSSVAMTRQASGHAGSKKPRPLGTVALHQRGVGSDGQPSAHLLQFADAFVEPTLGSFSRPARPCGGERHVFPLAMEREFLSPCPGAGRAAARGERPREVASSAVFSPAYRGWPNRALGGGAPGAKRVCAPRRSGLRRGWRAYSPRNSAAAGLERLGCPQRLGT